MGDEQALVGASRLIDATNPTGGMVMCRSGSANSPTSHRSVCSIPPWQFRRTNGSPSPGGTVFIDLETTGISGGAGTVAFLVGCGYFDLGAFQVRQFLLTSYSAERALLAAAAELFADADLIVTYNGKTFDPARDGNTVGIPSHARIPGRSAALRHAAPGQTAVAVAFPACRRWRLPP